MFTALRLLQVQRDYEELPEIAVGNLRNSLADLFTHFSQGPTAVRTQLALALAAMAAHAPPTQWEGGGVIPWFTERIRSQPQEVALACMLELLTVLPQVLPLTRLFLVCLQGLGKQDTSAGGL